MAEAGERDRRAADLVSFYNNELPTRLARELPEERLALRADFVKLAEA